MPALTTNIELLDACKRNHINCVGVFFKDRMPTAVYDGLYIINLADEGEPGTHWVGLYIEHKKPVYFDSFGFAPPEDIKKFVFPIDRSLEYNKLHIQNVETGICGYYVLFFGWWMTRSKASYPDLFTRFRHFQRLWSKNPEENRTRLMSGIKPLV